MAQQPDGKRLILKLKVPKMNNGNKAKTKANAVNKTTDSRTDVKTEPVMQDSKALSTPKPDFELDPAIYAVRNPEDILIVSFGSTFLRVGWASERAPFSRPNCIAYRRKKVMANIPQVSEEEILEGLPLQKQERMELQSQCTKRLKDIEALEKQTRKRRKLLAPRNRFFEDVSAVPIFDSSNDKSTSIDYDDFELYSDESNEHFYTGHNALRCSPLHFETIFPIRRGCFVGQDGKTAQVFCEQMQRIIQDAVIEDLHVQPRNFGKYSVALAVPDSFCRVEIHAVTRLFLEYLGFKELIIHKESVLSCFGAGVASACVVDVGSQKTHVCCVQDGCVIPSTSTLIPFGGEDITELFLSLVRRSDHFFGFESCNFDNPLDRAELEKAKEKTCHFSLADHTTEMIELRQRAVGEPTIVHKINVSDEAIMAPLALLDPYLQNPLKNVTEFMKPSSRNLLKSCQAFDCHRELLEKLYTATKERRADDAIKAKEGRAKNAAAAAAAASSSSSSSSSTSTPAETPKQKPAQSKKGKGRAKKKSRSTSSSSSSSLADKELVNGKTASAKPEVGCDIIAQSDNWEKTNCVFDLKTRQLALHVAITNSIQAIESPATKVEMATNILLAGGSVKFPGLVTTLEDRLIDHLPYSVPNCNTVEVLVSAHKADLKGSERKEMMTPKGVDPRYLSWRGGGILAQSDSSKDMWISKSEFLELDVRILREKVLFPW